MLVDAIKSTKKSLIQVKSKIGFIAMRHVSSFTFEILYSSHIEIIRLFVDIDNT